MLHRTRSGGAPSPLVGEGGFAPRSRVRGSIREQNSLIVRADKTPHPTRTSFAPPSPTRGEGDRACWMGASRPSRIQSCCVPVQMVAHESGDEIVAVVVAGLTAQRQRDVRSRTGSLQQLRAQLLGQELVGIAIIDQEARIFGAVFDQRHGVVRAPGVLVAAEIAAERLL